jgi:hypothetical protein
MNWLISKYHRDIPKSFDILPSDPLEKSRTFRLMNEATIVSVSTVVFQFSMDLNYHDTIASLSIRLRGLANRCTAHPSVMAIYSRMMIIIPVGNLTR